MNRRAFLALFTAGAAGMALDPERLLWVPGAKTIFLPTIITGFSGPRVIEYAENTTNRIYFLDARQGPMLLSDGAYRRIGLTVGDEGFGRVHVRHAQPTA